MGLLLREYTLRRPYRLRDLRVLRERRLLYTRGISCKYTSGTCVPGIPKKEI